MEVAIQFVSRDFRRSYTQIDLLVDLVALLPFGNLKERPDSHY